MLCTALLIGMTVADALVAAYWVGLIVGGGLLLFSVLAGQTDSDVDVHGGVDTDLHADFDTDVHAGDLDVHAEVAHDAGHVGEVHAAAGLSTWFSLRFVIFFLAAFGAVGVVLTHVAGARPGMTLAGSVAGGLVIGQAVHHLFRFIRRTSADSAPQPADYVNKLARVTIPMTHADKGEVAVLVKGGWRCVPALATVEGRQFAVGDEVVVVAYRAGVAHVVARAEFEQS